MNREELLELVSKEMHKSNRKYSYAPPLFHGTNRSSLLLSESERNELRSACEIIMNYLLAVCDNYGCDGAHFGSEELFGTNYSPITDAAQTAYFRRNGSDYYNYSSFYFTTRLLRAVHYANRAQVFGETGYQTYWLYEGVKQLGYELPQKTSEESNAFALFEHYTKQKDSPVLVMFCGLNMNDLKSESGKMDASIIKSNTGICSLRYLKSIDWNDGVIIDISDAESVDETLDTISNVQKDSELERFDSEIVRILLPDKTVGYEGACQWINKGIIVKLIEKGTLPKEYPKEESLMTTNGPLPKCLIYKLECLNENQPAYQSRQCFFDTLPKRKKE